MATAATEAQRADLVELVARAIDDDQQAWETLVRRYEGLITSITRRYRVYGDDADDVSQTVWMQLVRHLPQLRCPLALPGWISTTASRACLAVLADRQRTIATDPTDLVRHEAGADRLGSTSTERIDIDDALIKLESARAVREGLAELTEPQRDLLTLLTAEPPVSYARISEQLGVPIGSIGPNRARYLRRLRSSAALKQLTMAEPPCQAA